MNAPYVKHPVPLPDDSVIESSRISLMANQIGFLHPTRKIDAPREYVIIFEPNGTHACARRYSITSIKMGHHCRRTSTGELCCCDLPNLEKATTGHHHQRFDSSEHLIDAISKIPKRCRKGPKRIRWATNNCFFDTFFGWQPQQY